MKDECIILDRVWRVLSQVSTVKFANMIVINHNDVDEGALYECLVTNTGNLFFEQSFAACSPYSTYIVYYCEKRASE